MYSNCCSNHINLTSFGTGGQVFQHRPSLLNYHNVDPSLLSHFPSSPPCDDEEAVNEPTWQQLYDLFFQQQTNNNNNNNNNLITTADHHHHHHHHHHQMAVISSNNNNNMGADLKKEEEGAKRVQIISSRKRSSKKDRHSKINTAHGPRDRRMRLSLEVARKFFDLQDMLGFDKASKTVEWLLIQSSSSIKEVMGVMLPSTSEGDEGVSGIDDSTTTTTTTTTENQHHRQPSLTKKVNIKSSSKKETKNANNKQAHRRRTSAFHDRLARESRKIARERARKRTVEKKRLGGHDESIRSSFGESSGNNLQEQTPKIIIHHHFDHQLGLQAEVEELSSHDQQLLETMEYAPHDDSLVITADWNTSTFCNFQQNPQIIPHEHHFTDFDRSILF